MITNRTYADLNNEETRKIIIKLLNENGYIVNENDDDKTIRKIIRDFQRDTGCLYVDGFVGRQTLKAMGIDIEKEAEEIINPNRKKEEIVYCVAGGCAGVIPFILLSGLLFCLLMYMC